MSRFSAISGSSQNFCYCGVCQAPDGLKWRAGKTMGRQMVLGVRYSECLWGNAHLTDAAED
jgi:hypothetical protein